MGRIDLTNAKIGEWTVKEYLGKGKWRCECSCGVVKSVSGSNLRMRKTMSCGHRTDSPTNFVDLTGAMIGDWKVLEYAGKGMWHCECSCGVKKLVNGQSLRLHKSTSCGHNATGFRDITGMTFYDIYVRKYIGHQMYECECSCGKIYNVDGRSLRTGHTKSCGHATNAKIDMTGTKFGHWLVRSYIKNENNSEEIEAILAEQGLSASYLKSTFVLCECDCGRLRILNSKELRLGKTLSCGQCKRTDEQVEMTSTKEKFHTALNFEVTRLGHKLLLEEACVLLGLGLSATKYYISLYNGQRYIAYNRTMSDFEIQISRYIESLGITIEQSNREILDGKELDIYVPNKNFAIEANGVYWHSSEFKPKDYHQQKTLQCVEKGIHLMHIFEHEWKDEQTQQKIKNLIAQALNVNQQCLYARDTVVKEITNTESNEFLNKYHLQGSVNADTCLGLYYNDELVQVMTFGKPRFNAEYEIELLRLCTKAGYKVTGGVSKLFAYYINKYNPASIISYSDAAKFTGKVYEQLGMKYDGFTSINYMYVDTASLCTLNRMQCTKKKLIEQGYGTEEQTEEEIMGLRGFTRLYTCGNRRYVYQRA